MSRRIHGASEKKVTLFSVLAVTVWLFGLPVWVVCVVYRVYVVYVVWVVFVAVWHENSARLWALWFCC